SCCAVAPPYPLTPTTHVGGEASSPVRGAPSSGGRPLDTTAEGRAGGRARRSRTQGPALVSEFPCILTDPFEQAVHDHDAENEERESECGDGVFQGGETSCGQ